MKYTDQDKKKQKFFTEIPIPARSSESVIFSIKAEHCGVIDCSVDKVIVSDLIGFMAIPKKVGFRKTIPVLPVCYPFEAPVVNNMNTDDESDVFSEYKSGDNPSEVHDLRDYREGDSQNRIHWKLSSRYDGLIVRELSEPVSGSVLLIPDLFSCADKKQTDDILDLYATISGFLSEKRLKHSVIIYDDGIMIKNISSASDLVSLLEQQVRAINSEKPSPDIWTETLLSGFPAFTKYTHIICFVSGVRTDVLYEIEMMGIAERISVICLGSEKGDEIESRLSEIVFYNTSVESFYEDLRFFTV